MTSSSFDCLDNQSDEESGDEKGYFFKVIRLVEQEAKEILTNEEPIDIINLGTKDDKKGG